MKPVLISCLTGIAVFSGCGSPLVDSRNADPIFRNTAIRNSADVNADSSSGERRDLPRVPASSVVTLPDGEENAHYHEIKRGETLSGIGRQYNLSVGKLREANGLEENAILQPGQLLYIPR